MATLRTRIDQSTVSVMHAVAPWRERWHSLDRSRRTQLFLIATVVAIAFIITFVLLPALETRKNLAARLPLLEAQLSAMRSQAKDIVALAGVPLETIAPRTAADVASLQAIFGPGAQITAMPDGFRVVVPSISYASWWDKTGEALSRHALLLRDTSITRTDATAVASPVAVDMHLSAQTRTVASPAIPTPRQVK